MCDDVDQLCDHIARAIDVFMTFPGSLARRSAACPSPDDGSKLDDVTDRVVAGLGHRLPCLQ